jgi:hypothetical protein
VGDVGGLVRKTVIFLEGGTLGKRTDSTSYLCSIERGLKALVKDRAACSFHSFVEARHTGMMTFSGQ